MAQRRMFSKDITTSDLFVDMPQTSQLLYFHLGMEADDEGFIGNAKMLSRAYGTNNDDLKILEAKGFIIIFDSGVTVIKDWNLNNRIRKDRVKPTIYHEERNSLTLDSTGVYQMTTSWQPNDNQMTTSWQPNDRIGKYSVVEDSIDKDRVVEVEPTHFQEFLKIYEENKLSPVQLPPLLLEEIQKDLSENLFSIELFKCAVLDATSQGIFNYKYIRAILDGYRKRGLNTAEEVKQEQLAKEKNEGKVILDASTRVGGHEEPPF